MLVNDILEELKSLGNDSTKNIYLKHGAKEPFYGVKAEDLKKVQKRIKKNHELSLALYESGNSDAMYLAGLIADHEKITKKDLQSWADKAYWYMLSEHTVAQTAAKSHFGLELALKWIDSDKENIQSSGWSTLTYTLYYKMHLDSNLMQSLMQRIKKEIHGSVNRTRSSMNLFIISVGTYVDELTDEAMEIAEYIGKVKVDMGGTACKVPYAPDYILKARKSKKKSLY